jgi:uncharacterized membrane protein
VGALRREKSEVEIPEINLRSPVVLMLFAMILTGALLLIGPEFVYLRDNFGTRMNTLFKFYLQVWVLWALASAAGFWVLMDLAGRAARTVVAALMSAAVLLGLIYPIGTFLAKSNGLQNAQTLDGMAYFANAFPDDWAVIQWLDQNAGPQDVILEGTRGAYWLEGRSSRISMATGLPTVMGWSNHEGQWRGSYFAQVAGRESDIRLIYEARDWETAEALLNQYGVDYVIVSPLEREWYDVFEFKFDRFMDRVFQQGTVTVYAVP